MATSKGNLFGHLHGRIGSMYGRSVNGKNLIASMPTRNPDRVPTLAERQRRESFSALSSLASDFSDVIQIGLKNYRSKNRLAAPRNAFMHINSDIYTFDNIGHLVFLFKRLAFSRGRMPMPVLDAITPGRPNDYDITVTLKEVFDVPGCSLEDEFIVVAYCIDAEQHLIQTCTREFPKVTFYNIPVSWKETNINFYAFALGKGTINKKESSDTAYLGEIRFEP